MKSQKSFTHSDGIVNNLELALCLFGMQFGLSFK